MQKSNIKWQVIPTFCGYEASNIGSIRNKKTGRVLKQSKKGDHRSNIRKAIKGLINTAYGYQWEYSLYTK